MRFDSALAALVWCVVAAGCSGSQPTITTLSAEDDRAIRAVDSAYVAAWLKDDTAGVLNTLASDAVMLPAGQFPLTTTAEIKAYWWPSDSSHTRILTFQRVVDELHGAGDIAYMRGRDSLTFSYDKGSVHTQQSSRSMTLGVLRKSADGAWKMSRTMWAPRTR
jgi:ketosteroid isomerase-like protein